MKRYDMFGKPAETGAWVKYEDVVIRTLHHTDTINIIAEISYKRSVEIEELKKELAKWKA